MSIQSKMTAIADKIRALLGISGALGMDAMAANLQSAINETESQESLISQIEAALEGKTGAAAPEVTIGSTTVKLPTSNRSISFTGLSSQPKIFSIIATGQINIDSSMGSTRFVTGVMYDGDKTHGTYAYRASSSSSSSAYSDSYFTWTYSGDTLTVSTESTTKGGTFTSSVNFRLLYVL
jgi:hypothetical protein